MAAALLAVAGPAPFPETSYTNEHIDGAPIGFGPRVPMIICSPWTRGGYVDSNVYNHTSMLHFLANWTGVQPANVTAWRQSVSATPTHGNAAKTDGMYAFSIYGPDGFVRSFAGEVVNASRMSARSRR
jgi:hypothetical protein